MKLLRHVRRLVKAFATDDKGTAGLEFITTLPLLLGVMVFTAEYGQALRARMALDSATQDIARYLARAPMDNATGQDGVPAIGIYPDIQTTAQALMGKRVERLLAFEVSANTVDTDTFRDPFYVIEVRAWTYVDLPLLALINVFSETPGGDNIISPGETSTTGPNPLQLVLGSVHTVRWGGGAPPGSADCVLADRYRGLCP